MQGKTQMIGVLIEFEVKQGCEETFLKTWNQTTEIIYKNFGSLGSRLHHQEKSLYVAYAQWPNIDVYENEQHWSEEDLAVRAAMRTTLIGGKPKSVKKLHVVSDLLKEHSF